MWMLGCGARSALDENEERSPSDGGVDVESPDSGRASCETLELLSDPVAVFNGSQGTPYVVARGGGFDLVAGIRGAYTARRVEIETNAIRLGAEAILGAEARGGAAIAADGDRLALCYGARPLSGPTQFRLTDTFDYTGIRAGTIGDGAGDHCYAIAGDRGRWVVAWNERTTPTLSHGITEVDDTGRLIGPLRHVDNAPTKIITLSNGFAYVGRRAWSAYVDIGDERSFPISAAVEHVTLSESPFEEGAVEVFWQNMDGLLETAHVNGAGIGEHTGMGLDEAQIVSGPFAERMADGVAVSQSSCPGALEGSGSISIRMRLRDRVGPSLTIERPFCPVSPRIASSGERLLIFWHEEERFMTALVGCAAE